MDKNAIKKYAIWARRELIEKVSQRAMMYGITAKDTGDPNVDSVNGHLLSRAEKVQRQALFRKIREQGFEQVMEEVAYTWFNRFAALRFMEVNGYLPSHVRVFTNDAGEFKPQILSEAIHLELEGLDRNKVYELESANKTEELFKYLLIVQCNALNSILPGMFQKLEDYTELLLPDYLLREGSVIEQMVTTIPEEDWTDQVQIIGWLYQYYNTEPKDKVFADLKKNIKITKENIPAATQLFTPDWIVHYMVENSLGRLWLEGHPNDAMKAEFKYYLDEAEQEPEVEAQLAEIRKEYAALKPEEIKVIDPCCGSGHILCVLFDVLVRIYEDYGYTAREAAAMIVQNNLWGLDIDERAAQLSYFAVMMKARQYDRRFFSRNVQPHVYAIEESNGFTTAPLHDMGLDLTQEEYGEAVKQVLRLIEETHDAKEYGSIISVTPCDWDLLRRFAVPRWISEGGQIPMEIHGEIEAAPRLQRLCDIGEALSQNYHVVVTNPPYMGTSGMSTKLSTFLKREYPDSKSDLFAVFIERCGKMTSLCGYQALITQHAWMSLASYEKLRLKLHSMSIVNMAHLGARAFEEVSGEMVQTTSFVLQNNKLERRVATFCRLVNYATAEEKEKQFFRTENRYFAKQERFKQIPGAPVSAYVAGDALAHVYENGLTLNDIGEVKIGMGTGNNDLFLKLWWEVDVNKIDFSMTEVSYIKSSSKKYYPYSKGGERKRWYGNQEYVVWYDKAGQEQMKKTSGHRENGGYDYYFHKGMTWTYSTMAAFCARVMPSGFVFDVNGSSLFVPEKYFNYVLCFLQSCVGRFIIDSTKSAFSIQAGTIRNLPIVGESNQEIELLADKSIRISREDWDSFETSWDFQNHPLLITNHSSLREAYDEWTHLLNERINKLKKYEERINEIFIDKYGLSNELSPKEIDEEMTLHRPDLGREIKSFISYAVGCMFGRFSLGSIGLAYAGGTWNPSGYEKFLPDDDNVIPICDDEYFADDIVSRFVRFVEAAFGKVTMEENLSFIANALGGKGSAREVIRNYFINDFYADHLKIYQKRPIYWLFDSGKKNGFKCLIYMHRYQPDTIARIRTDYVHEQQSRYRTVIADLEQRINSASTSERVKLSKQLAKVRDQTEELRVYEEKIHHLADQMIEIDLDDGVKVNYAKFQDVLGKI